MRTWTLPTSRRHSRTRTRSSCMRSLRTRAAGSCLLPPRVVSFSGIGARAGLCGISLLGPPRGGGGGEEDQVDSLLRSSSTSAVAHAGLVWLVASRALFPVVVHRPEMLRIMAGMHQKHSCPRRTGNWIIWEMTSLCFRTQRNAWTSMLHGMRQPTVLWFFPRPLFLTVTCSMSFCSTGFWIFLGDVFWKCSCTQHLLV